MNSFSFIARGIEAEIERQTGVWESGGEVIQQTYDFDAASDALTARRAKEEADDYRYLPDPDLVPVEPPASWWSGCGAIFPELPGARVRRLESGLGLRDARTGSSRAAAIGCTRRRSLAGADVRATANVVMNQLAGAGVEPDAVDAGELAKLIEARESIPRGVFDRGDRRQRRPRLHGREVPGRSGRHGRVRARPGHRPDPGREREPGRGLPGRQGGPARLLRRRR